MTRTPQHPEFDQDNSAAADAHPPGEALAPGLYLVATPIGNARDITLRALDVLGGADCLAAEDTRVLRRLMELHGIPLRGRPIVSYHDRNGAARRPQIEAWLAEGRSVALTSDAGTPLVADPGFRLAGAAIGAGHDVTTIPGPSAALAALALSGLPSDRFLFAGFPPPKSAQRRKWLAEIGAAPATLILYEAPHRAAESLADMAGVLGPDRPGALARELTKRFEEVRRGTLAELAESARTDPPRGEIVLMAGPPLPRAEASEDEIDAALAPLLATLHVRDAAAQVADALGLPRRTVYARALALKGK